MELILPVIKCFFAACLDPRCRSIKWTTCKRAATMTGLTPFDGSCLCGYINVRSSETYLHIDLGGAAEYASILKTILRG